MASLLVEGERYEGLSSAAFLEHEYEALLLNGAEALFPALHVVRFKTPIVYESVMKRPDLALIDPRYRTWWVGEVERADHSLERHVLPQVEVFARGEYGAQHAAELANAAPQLDHAAIDRMMRGSQPGVAVIVNASVPGWVEPLRRAGAALVVVEVFRSARDRLIYRQNGADLSPAGDELSVCRLDSVFPRLLAVESPARLPVAEEELSVEYAGSVTRWCVIESGDRTWLSPLRGSPFPEGSASFRLVRSASGGLRFEAISEERRRRRRS